DAVAQAATVVFAVWPAAEKELISRLSPALAGKVVIDPSSPVGPDGHGGLARTLPEGESAASVFAKLLPAGARYVKAFGTVGAGGLGSAARSEFGRAHGEEGLSVTMSKNGSPRSPSQDVRVHARAVMPRADDQG